MVDSYPDNPSSFTHLLRYNLAYLPDKQLSKAGDLPGEIQPLLFNLAVFHTSVAMLPARADDLAPVHYSNFLTAVDRVLSGVYHHPSSTESTSSILELIHHHTSSTKSPPPASSMLQSMLQSLSMLVLDMYSSCAPKDKLLPLVHEILTLENCSPNAHIRPHPDVELTTPTSTISQDRFIKDTENISEHGIQPQKR
jgi:hypothetical protein